MGAEREPHGPGSTAPHAVAVTRPGVRRGPPTRQVVVSAVRALLTVVVMMVLYFTAPVDQAVDVRLGLRLAAGLLVLGVAVAWQVRAIVVSTTPRLRAAETVAVALPFLLLLFAEVYLLMSSQDPASFSEPLSRVDALYFTVTVFATVGFGDVAPVTDQARIVAMVQMAVGLAAVGIVAKLLVGAVQHAVTTAPDREAPQRGPGPRG